MNDDDAWYWDNYYEYVPYYEGIDNMEIPWEQNQACMFEDIRHHDLLCS